VDKKGGPKGEIAGIRIFPRKSLEGWGFQEIGSSRDKSEKEPSEQKRGVKGGEQKKNVWGEGKRAKKLEN